MTRTKHDAVEPSVHGVRIHLHVTTGAPQSHFPTGYNPWRKRIEAAVQAPPQNNQANTQLIQLIATFLTIPPKNIKLVSGHKNRDKTIEITHHSPQSITSKIMEALP